MERLVYTILDFHFGAVLREKCHFFQNFRNFGHGVRGSFSPKTKGRGVIYDDLFLGTFQSVLNPDIFEIRKQFYKFMHIFYKQVVSRSELAQILAMDWYWTSEHENKGCEFVVLPNF